MTVTAKLYGLYITALNNEEHDTLDDTIKVMLVSSSYTPDQDTHNYKDDITNEITGTGYSAGGAQITTDTITYTSGTNVTKYDGDDTQWTSSTITARTAVVYNATGGGTDGTRGLIGYQQESADITSSAGTWQVVWASAGIWTITVS